MHRTPYLTILPLLRVHCLFQTRQLENWQMSLLTPHLPVVSLKDHSLSSYPSSSRLSSGPAVLLVDQPLTYYCPLRPSPPSCLSMTSCLSSGPVVFLIYQLLTQLWPLRRSPHAPSPRSRTSTLSTCTTAGSPTSPSPPSTDSRASDFFASQAMLLAICPLHRWPATTNTSTILTRSTYCLFLAEWARASRGAESGWQLYWGEIIFVTKLWLILF